MARRLKSILPWLLALLVLGYLLSQNHPRDLINGLSQTDLWIFSTAAIFYFLIVYGLDVWSLHLVFNRFVLPTSAAELVRARGATYLLSILNFNAGQGALAIYFHKTRGAPLAKGLGAVLFMSAIDLLLVATCALLALSFLSVNLRGINLSAWGRIAIPLLYLGYALWSYFWRHIGRGTLEQHAKNRFVRWFLAHGVFHTFREARVRDHVTVFLMRAPLLAIVLGAYNAAIYASGALINWTVLYLYNPIIMLITALPLTPAGLGTGQALTVELFRHSLTGPALATVPADTLLLTSSLIWFLANQILKGITGAICLRGLSKNAFTEDSTLNKI